MKAIYQLGCGWLLCCSVAVLADNTQLNSNSSITTGDNNTLIGVDAGRNTTTQSGNTLLGNQAGYYNQADESLFMGYQAGFNNLTGERNSFVGTQAGYSNTTGSDNTFFGTKSGYANTGSRNTFAGEEAGMDTTSGDDNTFVGEDAGRSNLTGYRNTAVGKSAFYSSGTKSAWGNSLFGYQSGYDLSEGKRNTLIGSRAGVDVSAGNFNTLVGARAGEYTESGDYNTFVGTLAGRENNRTNGTGDANRNTYLGAAAGSVNRVGVDNVILGAFADFASWTGTAADIETGFKGDWGDTTGMPSGSNTNFSRITALGAYTLARASDALVLGYGAEASATATQGAIVIGANSTVSHTNAIVIGDNATSQGNNILSLGNADTSSWQPYANGATALGGADYRFANTHLKSLNTRAASDSSASWVIAADNGEDAGDSWQVTAADGGELSFNNNASGSYSASMTLASNGDLSISGDLTLASDARLKTAIEPIDNGLPLVALLQPVSYRWLPALARDQELHYGFIAQQVAAVLPELVTENAEGIKSVNYVEITPLLISALQQLEAESRSLDAQIAQLEMEINALIPLAEKQ